MHGEQATRIVREVSSECLSAVAKLCRIEQEIAATQEHIGILRKNEAERSERQIELKRRLAEVKQRAERAIVDAAVGNISEENLQEVKERCKAAAKAVEEGAEELQVVRNAMEQPSRERAALDESLRAALQSVHLGLYEQLRTELITPDLLKGMACLSILNWLGRQHTGPFVHETFLTDLFPDAVWKNPEIGPEIDSFISTLKGEVSAPVGDARPE